MLNLARMPKRFSLKEKYPFRFELHSRNVTLVVTEPGRDAKYNLDVKNCGVLRIEKKLCVACTVHHEHVFVRVRLRPRTSLHGFLCVEQGLSTTSDSHVTHRRRPL